MREMTSWDKTNKKAERKNLTVRSKGVKKILEKAFVAESAE